ncbi:relaxin receptor 2 [Nilaparvata lugens]|uniref:relaxin receptor 2 n=1 Tax=Nilaparvata lugens TaxID=108931 RepID=UPI00193D6E38|nr:relaxin receptor 2 [Nilaparvata lugens]
MLWSGTVVLGCSVLAILALTAVLILRLSQGEEGKCPVGTFTCTKSFECIPKRYICNSHDDCVDGEDETFRVCVDWTDGTGSFFKKIKPKPANDSENDSENDKPDCDLGEYPVKTCNCSEGNSLNCANAGFISLPSSIPRNVTSLDLDNNRIGTLSKNAFQGMPLLTILFLSNNNIELIEEDVFSCSSSVLTLKLNNNRLSKLNLQTFGGLLELNVIDLSYNFLTLDDESFPPLLKLEFLRLESNKIRFIHRDTFGNLVGMLHLNLRENNIMNIHNEAFSNLKSLEDLDLTHNQLHIVSSGLFSSLKALATLRLGQNFNLIVPDEAFVQLKNLSSLNLQDIEIDNINVDMLDGLTNLKFVYFKRFHYCSYAPAVKQCLPNTDGVSSFGHLLEKPVLRITVWLMAFFTCFANLLVLWGRHISDEENRAFSYIVKSLAVSDFLIGLYLLAIAYHDYMYREVYNSEAHNWMTSWRCTMIGILAMTSSEVSVLILVFMSIERFLKIENAFGEGLTLKKAIVSTAAIWFVGIFIAIIPVILWRGKSRFYGTNGLCFPLHIDDPFFLGWQYSAFIFLGINMFGLILMSCFYGRLFVSYSRTRQATPVNLKEYDLAIRCFFFVVADAACWLPIFILKVLVFFNIRIPTDLYGWVVVFILPVNSAVNPILYTFTTQQYRDFFLQLFRVHLRQHNQALVETDISGPSNTRLEPSHPLDRVHWP